MSYGLQVFNSDSSIEIDTSTKVGKIISITDYSVSAGGSGAWFTKAAPGATIDGTTIVHVLTKGNGVFQQDSNDPNNSSTAGNSYVVTAGSVRFNMYNYTGVITVIVIGY